MSEPKRRDANGKMRFASIEEFVADQREHILPLLDELRMLLALRPNQQMELEYRQLMSLFENDCELLRQCAKRAVKPDGSLEFNFSADALKFLRSKDGV